MEKDDNSDIDILQTDSKEVNLYVRTLIYQNHQELRCYL